MDSNQAHLLILHYCWYQPTMFCVMIRSNRDITDGRKPRPSDNQTYNQNEYRPSPRKTLLYLYVLNIGFGFEFQSLHIDRYWLRVALLPWSTIQSLLRMDRLYSTWASIVISHMFMPCQRKRYGVFFFVGCDLIRCIDDIHNFKFYFNVLEAMIAMKIAKQCPVLH